MSFFILLEGGIEPISMQLSSGQLLVAGLDGDNTFRFFSVGEETANRVLLPAPNKKSTPSGVLFLFARNIGLEPI